MSNRDYATVTRVTDAPDGKRDFFVSYNKEQGRPPADRVGRPGAGASRLQVAHLLLPYLQAHAHNGNFLLHKLRIMRQI
jgi:hypothetical protein